MHAGGRPPLFKSEDEIIERAHKYFSTEDEGKDTPTITGLALYLGFESRQSFYDYEENPEFSYTIKRLRLRIENGYEKKLYGNNVAGPIFALKNLGWKDVQGLDHSGSLAVNWLETRNYEPNDKTDQSAGSP